MVGIAEGITVCAGTFSRLGRFVHRSEKQQPRQSNCFLISDVLFRSPLATFPRKRQGYRIVGFYVEPISVKHHYVDGWEWDGVAVEGRSRPLETCSNSQWLNSDQVEEFQTVKEGEQVLFTYDVIWSESETKWASRWDIYLSMDNRVPARIHWFSIINSLLIICFLSAIVGMILVKNLKRDISNYNRVLTDEEKAEEREVSRGVGGGRG